MSVFISKAKQAELDKVKPSVPLTKNNQSIAPKPNLSSTSKYLAPKQPTAVFKPAPTISKAPVFVSSAKAKEKEAIKAKALPKPAVFSQDPFTKGTVANSTPAMIKEGTPSVLKGLGNLAQGFIPDKKNRESLVESLPAISSAVQTTLGRTMERGGEALGLKEDGIIRGAGKGYEAMGDENRKTANDLAESRATSNLPTFVKLLQNKDFEARLTSDPEFAKRMIEKYPLTDKEKQDLSKEKTFLELIQDKDYAKNLISGNILNTLASLGVGVATTLVTKNPYAGLASGFATSATLEGGYARNQAKTFLENSENPELRALAQDPKYLDAVAVTPAIVNASLEMLPIGAIINRLPMGDQVKAKVTQKVMQKIGSLLLNVGTQAVAEGGTESIQEIVNNAVAQLYDEEQGLFEGVGASGVVGAMTGAGTSIITDTGIGAYEKGKSAVELYNSLTPQEKQKGAINWGGLFGAKTVVLPNGDKLTPKYGGFVDPTKPRGGATEVFVTAVNGDNKIRFTVPQNEARAVIMGIDGTGRSGIAGKIQSNGFKYHITSNAKRVTEVYKYGGVLTIRELNAIKNDKSVRRDEELDEQDKRIIEQVSKEEVEDLLKRAYPFVKDYYPTFDEWMANGSDMVAMELESQDVNLQRRSEAIRFKAEMPDGSGEFRGDVGLSDIIDMYVNGKLTKSSSNLNAPKRTDIPMEKVAGIKPTQFSPQDVQTLGADDAKVLFATATAKQNKGNKAEVQKARQLLFIQYNADRGLADKLGIKPAELNKKIRGLAGFPSSGRETQMNLNEGTPDQFKWVGISNSSYLTKQAVDAHAIDALVKDIDDKTDQFYQPDGNMLRNYILRTFLAIDTRISFKDLSFNVKTLERALGQYSNKDITITIHTGGANTVAHEIGHYLDYLWGREIGMDNALSDISQSGYNLPYLREQYNISDEHVTWLKNFGDFTLRLSNASDIGYDQKSAQYSQTPTETFARFVDKFVQWANKEAGVRQWEESSWYNDKFTEAQYREFVKLLQEKAYIDSKYKIKPILKKGTQVVSGKKKKSVPSNKSAEEVSFTGTNDEKIAQFEKWRKNNLKSDRWEGVDDSEALSRLKELARSGEAYDVFYHGTQDPKTANKIRKEGFKDEYGAGVWVADYMTTQDVYYAGGRSTRTVVVVVPRTTKALPKLPSGEVRGKMIDPVTKKETEMTPYTSELVRGDNKYDRYAPNDLIVIPDKSIQTESDVEDYIQSLEVEEQKKPSVPETKNIQGTTVTRQEVLDMVRDRIKEMMNNDEIDRVTIVDMRVIGSRTEGRAKKRSDLDVLVEYSGRMREDDLFNALNDDPLKIDGIRVDINPIHSEKTGTIAEFLKRAEDDLVNKSEKPSVPVKKSDVISKEPVLNLKRAVPITEVNGQKDVIPEGEAVTPYMLKGGKVLIKDGDEWVVSKNQYQNIKANSKSTEVKDFAKDLKQTKSVVNSSKGNFDSFTDEEMETMLSEYDEDPTGMSRAEIEARIIEINDNDMGSVLNREEGEPKYQQYTLPNGEDYKEILITSPEKKYTMADLKPLEDKGWKFKPVSDDIVEAVNPAGAFIGNSSIEYLLHGGKGGGLNYQSSHWNGIPNVLAHIRMNTRKYKGKAVAFLEELQSDWAREGRDKGFASTEAKAFEDSFRTYGDLPKDSGDWSMNVLRKAGVPEAKISEWENNAFKDRKFGTIPQNPLLKNWQELAIRRALFTAVEDKAEYFAWINGDQTSARYNLATQVKDVKWEKSLKQPDGTYGKQITIMPTVGTGNAVIVVIDKEGTIRNATDRGQGWTGKKLDEVLGKGLADSIMAKGSGTLSGEGLKFGGEWANNLYDKQVANIVRDLTGAEVITLDLGLPLSKDKERWYHITDNGTIGSEVAGAHMLQRGDVITRTDSNDTDFFTVVECVGDGKFKVVAKKYYDDAHNKNISEGTFASGNKGYQYTDKDGRVVMTNSRENAEKALDWKMENMNRLVKTIDLSEKTQIQQAIKLTHEVVAIVKSMPPVLKQPSGKEPQFVNAEEIPDIDPAIFKKPFTELTQEEKYAILVRENNTGLSEKLENEALRLSFVEDEIKESPLKNLVKYKVPNSKYIKDYFKNFKGGLPEVTGFKYAEINGVKELPYMQFAREGDAIIDTSLYENIGLNDTEEIRDAFDEYLSKREQYREDKKAFVQAKRDYIAQRDINNAEATAIRKRVRDEIRGAKGEGKRIRSRQREVKAYINALNLEKSEKIKIQGGRSIDLMLDKEYEEFLDALQAEANKLQEKRQARMQLEYTISSKELSKVENLQKAFHYPTIKNMSTQQLREFDEMLQDYKQGDEFLTVRQIQTVDATDLQGIKTLREARERLAVEVSKVEGHAVSPDELKNIRVGEMDRMRYDTDLARTNPFYNLMVTEWNRAILSAEMIFRADEKKMNELVKKARASRPRSIAQRLVPTDEKIFAYMEAKPAVKQALKRDMTKEELAVADYMTKQYEDMRDYLIKMEVLKKYRQDYITHIRRGFLETWKTDGLLTSFKEVFEQYQDEEMSFRILEGDTGMILPLEKFFQYSMKRTGKMKATQNVARAYLTYSRMFEKKRMLDAVIPKIDIYAHSLTPKHLTPKGLEMDRTLKTFMNEWLNNKKGRKARLFAIQGGKIELSLRAIKAFTTIRDLGLNIPVGLSAQVGEQVSNFIGLGSKKYVLGKQRMWTRTGKRIVTKYQNFVGRSPFDEITDATKNVGDQVLETLFGLFQLATVQANKAYLLGSMTDEEYKNETISNERLAEIRKEMGKYRVLSESKSVYGSTAVGGLWTQYKTWAIPHLTTTYINMKRLARMLRNGEVKDMASSKEAQELFRSIVVMGLIGVMLGAWMDDDEDDKSFTATLLRKSYRDAMTSFGALDPRLATSVPRVLTFISELAVNVYQILSLEEYKEGEKKGELKGDDSMVRTLKPTLIKQITDALDPENLTPQKPKSGLPELPSLPKLPTLPSLPAI